MVPSLWSWSVKSTGRWTNPWSSTLPPRKNTSRYMMSHKRRLTLHSRNFVTCTHKHIHTHVYKHSNTNKKRGVCVWRWLGQGSKKQTLKRLLYKVKKNKPTTNKCVLYTLYLFVFTPSFSVEGSRAVLQLAGEPHTVWWTPGNSDCRSFGLCPQSQWEHTVPLWGWVVLVC